MLLRFLNLFYIFCSIIIHFLFTKFKFFTELLRVIRRFSLKELLMDDSLHYLCLKILSLALSANSRGQNHFKSIGGLEVLLDGFGFPSNYAKNYSNFVLADGFRYCLVYLKPIILYLIKGQDMMVLLSLLYLQFSFLRDQCMS